MLEVLGEFGLAAPVLELLELGADCDEELLALPVSPPCVDDEDDGDEELEEPLIEPLVLPVEEPIEEPLFRLLPLVEPDAEPLTLSAVRVWSSIEPEAEMPFCCWNFFSAALVFGPAMPSTGPALKPWSFRACWTCETFELSPDDDEAEEDDDGVALDEEDDGDAVDDCVLIAGDWL